MGTFLINLTTQQLLSKARELTGIADIVDSSVEMALEKWLHSLNTEAELSKQGAADMEQRLIRLLSNRLRMLRDFREHPEIHEQKIVPPLIISGAARTGSTKLHKMLAVGGDFLYLPFWQSHNPALFSGVRTEDPLQRIEDAEAYVRRFDEAAPRAKFAHAYSTFEPEEENLIHEHNICSPYPLVMAFVPSYMQWWAGQDFRQQLEFIKQALKYIQWQFHDGDTRPWILKCPLYPGHEPLLAEVFPGAKFVATHRHPAIVISSAASLYLAYTQAYSDVSRKTIAGPMWCDIMASLYENYVSVRDKNPQLPMLDVSYSKNICDGISVMENIYSHLGIPLSDKARLAMIDWEKRNGQHKLGAHKHSLSDFSLSEEMVSQRCADYIQRFWRHF